MENKDSPKSEEKKTKKQDNELYWVLGVMVGLIAIFLVASSVVQSFSKVEYNGLTFTKEKLGDIQLFKYYYVTDKTVATGKVVDNAQLEPVIIYLRTNPNENEVPINGGKISFPRGKKVWVGIGDDLESCKYSPIAVSSVSSFISQNGFAHEAGLTDKTEAEENDLAHVECSVYPNNPVIILKKGDETAVNIINENCYEIVANDCEILPASEKFIVQTILDAKENP